MALIRQAAQLAAAGVDFLQLREKDLPSAELAALARTLINTLRPSSTRLLVNSRVDIAIAVRADGVHLTSSPDELTPGQVRDLYTVAGLPAPVVTVSCHTLGDIVRLFDPLHPSPVNAILFGPVFEKVVTDQGRLAGTGLDLLHQACEAARPTPVLALGGITPDNTALCVRAGARGVAGIRLFSAEER